MRAYKNGNVSVSEDDIRAFNAQWPGSNLRGLRGVTFGFDRRGDLTDIFYKNGDSDRWDGSALAALSQDAQAYSLCANNRRERARDLVEFRRSGFPWWWPKSWGK